MGKRGSRVGEWVASRVTRTGTYYYLLLVSNQYNARNYTYAYTGTWLPNLSQPTPSRQTPGQNVGLVRFVRIVEIVSLVAIGANTPTMGANTPMVEWSSVGRAG